MSRPLRGSAAIDWLADRNPLTITTWDDPVVEVAGHSSDTTGHDTVEVGGVGAEEGVDDGAEGVVVRRDG